MNVKLNSFSCKGEFGGAFRVMDLIDKEAVPLFDRDVAPHLDRDSDIRVINPVVALDGRLFWIVCGVASQNKLLFADYYPKLSKWIVVWSKAFHD